MIITNNSKVNEKFKDQMEVFYFEEATYLEILEKARDQIHRGAKLLSHPMAGSLKPNQTPYRSLLLEKPKAPITDLESLSLIENSIESAKKFLADRKVPDWPAGIKEDFKTVDLSVISSAIK